MNFIRKLYNKIKSSYDEFWIEYEIWAEHEMQMKLLTTEEQTATHENLFNINKFKQVKPNGNNSRIRYPIWG